MNKYINSFIFLLLLLILSIIKDFISSETLFIIYTSLLIFYLLFEVIFKKNKDKESYLLNPVVLSSFFTFILGFGLTNFVFLDEDGFYWSELYNRFGANAFGYLADAMPLVIIAAIAMWAGYHSGLGRHLFRFLTSSIIPVKKYLRKSFEIRFELIIYLAVLSFIARFIAIYLGIFGYSQDPETVSRFSGIDLPLNLLGELGKFCLLIISLAYFTSPEIKKYKITFVVILIFELFFGILSGMKSAIILPFVIIFLTYFFIHRKIKKTYAIYFIISIAVAYTIVEPFRMLRMHDPNFKSTPGYILSTFTEAYSLSKKVGFAQSELTENVFLSAFMRNNYVIEIAKAKEYNDKVGLKEDDPNFKGLLFTVPFWAYVPRAIWTSKPIPNLGGWFTQKVWGMDIISATAMTPFGFLYFAGGIPFIIIFLFIIGVMQHALFKFIELSSGGVIIYIGLLSTVVFIDSNVSGIFISWLRMFPILLVLQYIIFKR